MSTENNLTTTNVANPFGTMPKQTNSALIETESQRSIQEVQAALVIAKKFPRNPIEAVDKIMQSCTRKTLAESALYSYNRGGADITGPSIRLAETLAQNWGNIQYGIKELSQENGSSTVEAFAWDIETNTRQVKIFQVKHERFSNKKGNTKLTDQRDIYEVVANNGARRLRACILGVIPGDVTEAAIQQCEATMKANADTSPEAVKKLIEAFKELGVTDEMLQKRINKRLEAINAAQIIQLRKVYTSLRDGMSKIEDWFDINAVATNLTNAFKDTTPEPATSTQPIEQKPTKAQKQANVVDNIDQSTGEILKDESPKSMPPSHTAEDYNVITDIINLVSQAKGKNLLNEAQLSSYEDAISNNFADFDTENLTSTKEHLVKLLNPS